ncbi:MAG: hypothetical protein ACOH14_07685 [Rhodoglobus sp.]
MTQYEDTAAAVLLALQNYARDLEADLGKIERNTVAGNPNFGDVQRLTEPATWKQGPGAGENAAIAHQKLSEYKNYASEALSWVGMRDGLSGPEITARTAVKTLVTSIRDIGDHADAVALVATFN